MLSQQAVRTVAAAGQGRRNERGMKALQKVGRNFSVVAAAQAVTWTATFFFTLAQARYLGPARFAEFSLALSYAAFLGVVVDFGLSTKLARDVAQRPAAAGEALLATIVVRVGVWCLVMPLVWLAIVMLGYNAELQASILILGVSLLIGGFATSLGAYFQGREEFLVPSVGSIALRGSAAVLGVAALAVGHGVLAISIVYVVASLLQLVVMVWATRRHRISLAAFEWRLALDMFRGVAALGLFWMLGAFYYNVDMLILQRLAPLENVAWYAAAYRLFNAALMAVAVVAGGVLYPVVSRLSVGPREELRRAMERTFVLLLATGVFLALVVVVAADQLVAFLYSGREYAEAATALRLLTPALVGMYANGVFFLALLGMRFDRRLLVMAAVLAVLNPLANLLVIPVLQQNGAALTTSATELIVLAWVLALTPADLRRAANPAAVAKILVAAVPAAACLWLLRDWPLVLGVPASAVVYGCAGLVLGILPADDRNAIRRFLARARSRVEARDAAQVVVGGPVDP